MLSLKYSLYNNLNPKKDLKFIYDINLNGTYQKDSETFYYFAGEKERAVDFWQQALARAAEVVPEPGQPVEDRQQILTRKIKLKKYQKE